jgi:hypothetical protein
MMSDLYPARRDFWDKEEEKAGLFRSESEMAAIEKISQGHNFPNNCQVRLGSDFLSE